MAAAEAEGQQDSDNQALDYDELTLKPPKPSEPSGIDLEKNKPRHYWTPKEEESFFEIWGRDNWCLTRNGKNTVHFGRWSEELKDRFGIDVRPEEIQAKVNQTRAKFRQVKKQSDLEKTNVRWKKFGIIDKILRNQYRPKDADPLPADASERNRDYSPTELSAGAKRQPTSPSLTSNSNTTDESLSNCQIMDTTEQQINVEPNMTSVNITDHNLSTGLYNSNSDGRVNYSGELFSDDIKTEYDDDIKGDEYQSGYHNYQYQQESPNSYVPAPTARTQEPEPQLHQLQTPQQQQQQQQQQYHAQQQQQYNTISADGGNIVVPHLNAEQHLPQNIIQITQPHQLLQQPAPSNTYEHSSNSYSATAVAVTTQDPNSSLLTNNQNHYGNSSSASTLARTSTMQSQNSNIVATPHQYTNNNAGSNNTYPIINNGSNVSMQPPRPTPQPRRRRGPAGSNNTAAAAVVVHQTADNSIEILYMEEVRKKNIILEEHKEIDRKRLQLEERNLALMEQFLPKCLELQEQILHKLNGA